MQHMSLNPLVLLPWPNILLVAWEAVNPAALVLDSRKFFNVGTRRVEHKDALFKPRSISNEKGVGDVRQSPNSVIDFMGTACTSLMGASV